MHTQFHVTHTHAVSARNRTFTQTQHTFSLLSLLLPTIHPSYVLFDYALISM